MRKKKTNTLLKLMVAAVLLLLLGMWSLGLFIFAYKVGYQSGITAPPAQKLISACTRKQPYPKAPEIERGFSLLLQRMQGHDEGIYNGIKNCVDIQYRDLTNDKAEAMFVPSESDRNRLTIYIDESYSQMDDLSIAFVLAHELTHAVQNQRRLVLYQPTNFPDDEVEAFKNQLVFSSLLNQDEQDALMARAERDADNPQVQYYLALLDIGYKTAQVCKGKNGDCAVNDLNARLKDFVLSLGYVGY